MQETAHLPLPEMLGRRDTEYGQWRIDSCAPVRGLPHTNIIDKQMVVPVSPEETERCIRAHEMMHAKVSPADDFPRWIERGIATDTALRAVEELRVNFLIGKAGFDAMTHLTDGSELAAGEKLAQRGDWAGCVYTTIGFSATAGLKQFLTGVRRHNREWGDVLRDIAKKAEKEIAKVHAKGVLANTERDPNTGLAPLGFSHVERIAEWVDRLANPPQEENEDENGEDQQEAQNGKTGEQGKETGKAEKAGNGQPKAPITKDQVKRQKPADTGRRGVVPQWMNLRVSKLPLTRHAPGGMGRKRRANDIGRNPRRINRMLVDPQKRIFDATKKGNGGVVVIDGSGSMHLDERDILRIVEAAPGATVAVYSTDSDNTKDNLWVLAEKGKMVDKLPKRHGGNGVDAPALKWGINQRQHANAPVVFVTDGMVHGVRDGYNDTLAMDCINLCLKHKVLVRSNVDSAVKALEEIKVGRKPSRWFPRVWSNTYRELTGNTLK